MLARAMPALPCSVLLEIEEWQALEVPSSPVPRRLPSHPRWARRCAGWHSLAALWAGVPATTRGPKRCDVACNISVISRECMVLCVPLHPKRKNVSIWQAAKGGSAVNIRRSRSLAQ